MTPGCLNRLGEVNSIAIRVLDVRNALSPRHVVRLAERTSAKGLHAFQQAIDVPGVHAEQNPLLWRTFVLLRRGASNFREQTDQRPHGRSSDRPPPLTRLTGHHDLTQPAAPEADRRAPLPLSRMLNDRKHPPPPLRTADSHTTRPENAH